MTPANLMHPERYHGLPQPHGFEGWYFKLVDADRSRPVAIIPGIFAKGDETRDERRLERGRHGRGVGPPGD
ncbi:MAG: hypothetical protein ACP5G7_09165 [Anaerolineae bacterium]